MCSGPSALAGFGRVTVKDALATPWVWRAGGHAGSFHWGFLLCPLLSDRSLQALLPLRGVAKWGLLLFGVGGDSDSVTGAHCCSQFLFPVAVSLDWSKWVGGKKKKQWKWKPEGWMRWSRALNSFVENCCKESRDLSLVHRQLYQQTPRAYSYPGLTCKWLLGGTPDCFLLGQRPATPLFSSESFTMVTGGQGCLTLTWFLVALLTYSPTSSPSENNSV